MHCSPPAETCLNLSDRPKSLVARINNKIKLIKRNAYGYHDERYFALKVKQASDPNRGN